MRLKMKNVDWKKFLLENGERVALYGCLGVMGLMLIFGLFMPGRGLFSGSATENARKLDEQNKRARQEMASSKPSDEEKQQMSHIPDELLRSGEQVKLDSKLVASRAPLFLGINTDDTRRRPPRILGPVEFSADVTLARIPVYIFDKTGKRILVLEGFKLQPGIGEGSFVRPSQAQNTFNNISRQFGGPPSGSPFQRQSRPEDGGGGPPSPGGEESPFGTVAKGLKPRYVPLEELAKSGADARLAEDIYPVPMVIVAGSFPLREQVKNFQQALRLRTLDQVFADRPDSKGVPVPQFQFAGLNIERRTVGPDGKPTSEWTARPVKDIYTPMLIATGSRFADDRPDLQQLIYPGLVMLRPPYPGQTAIGHLGMMEGGLGREGDLPGPRAVAGPPAVGPEGTVTMKPPATDPYPEVERRLQTLRATLAELAKPMLTPEGQALTNTPDRRFRPKNFDPFSPTPTFSPEEEQRRAAEEVRGVPDPAGTNPELAQWQPPEYCLLRFIDFDLKPGMTYEYRIQVKMKNPNHNLPEKALIYPSLREGEEIVSKDWFLVRDTDGGKNLDGPPLRITVLDDSYFYAIERPINASKNEAAIQFHQWVDYVTPPGAKGTKFAVGDWIVADNVLVNRGEFMRRTEEKPPPAERAAPRAAVPIWMYNQYDFVLARDSSVGRGYEQYQYTLPLPFAPGNGDYLTVDFQGGQVSHGKVKDKAPTELIYLSPDGKLLVKNSEVDRHDPIRKDRAAKYMRRIEGIRDAAKRKAEEARKAIQQPGEGR